MMVAKNNGTEIGTNCAKKIDLVPPVTARTSCEANCTAISTRAVRARRLGSATGPL